MSLNEASIIKRVIQKPFDRSYWVVPANLLAGCYPGAKGPDQSFRRLHGLLKSGIRYVINLMEELETDYSGGGFVPYDGILNQIAHDLAVNLQIARYPIRDNNVPTRNQMIAILDAIDHAIGSGQPAYVHCWGGVGRTGTVVGCYLARHGIADGRDCLTKIRELRNSDPTAHRNSPETLAQAEMVTSWKFGE